MKGVPLLVLMSLTVLSVQGFWDFFSQLPSAWNPAPLEVPLPPAIDAYLDTKCTERRGKCQYTSSPCSGGKYFSGFCGGPANRRCCVETGRSGCMKVTEQMACQLVRSSKVTAIKYHPSGVKDNAFAYNNLLDLCSGKKPSRSSYKSDCDCNAPGGTTCLSFNLLNYLLTLKKGKGSIMINEIAGACHSCTSRHYSGLAVDLQKNGREGEYLVQCPLHFGRPINHKNHVHCQFYDGQHPNWR